MSNCMQFSFLPELYATRFFVQFPVFEFKEKAYAVSVIRDVY